MRELVKVKQQRWRVKEKEKKDIKMLHKMIPSLNKGKKKENKAKKVAVSP